MEPNPSCAILTPSNSRVPSGPLTIQAFGVCENETSWRETFIWTSQQMGPKCVSCSITIKHTQPGWWIQYPFWSINLTDWKGKGFFSMPCSFQWLADSHFPVHPILQLNEEIMFRSKDYDWQSGREMHIQKTDRELDYFSTPASKNLHLEQGTSGKESVKSPNLKMQAINYSQPVHFSPFVP